MPNDSLDKFYDVYAGFVNVIGTRVRDRRVTKFIRMCRLRPERLAREHIEASKATKLEKLWLDEYGNTLRLMTHRLFRVTFNDISVDRGLFSITDLYRNVSLRDLFLISKLLYIVTGVDDETNDEVYILAFLGKDNYLRLRLFLNGTLHKDISPLFLGPSGLRLIVDNANIRYFISYGKKPHLTKPDVLYPLGGARHWFTSIPMHEHFLTKISNDHPGLFDVLNVTLKQGN